VGVDDAQLHGEVAGLEDDRPWMSGSIVDVLEIQAGVGGDEEVGLILLMGEGGDAAVASAVAFEDVVIDSVVVSDDGFDGSAFEDHVVFVGNFEGD